MGPCRYFTVFGMSGFEKPKVVYAQTSGPTMSAGMTKNPPPGQIPVMFIIFRMSFGNGPVVL
jgi:hypothetical protein